MPYRKFGFYFSMYSGTPKYYGQDMLYVLAWTSHTVYCLKIRHFFIISSFDLPQKWRAFLKLATTGLYYSFPLCHNFDSV